ncbi:hypothetical protein [Sodalis sp. dw_96]|uniref:hypothetical protein n=1 Tax=Sodalis sp. dw_96 TaxID=2719794 RepID=UPI001BD239B4|nr:hypothetical protein [Sodalis sp. dw_96]
MLDMIHTNAPFHLDTTSNYTPLLKNKLNNFALTRQVKNAIDIASRSAIGTGYFPKIIQREIKINEKKLKQGELKINDNIVYAKQYKGIRIKRGNDGMLPPLLKNEQSIPHVSESKIDVKGAVQSQNLKQNGEISVTREPSTPVTELLTTMKNIEATTIPAKAPAEAEPVLKDNVSASGALLPTLTPYDITRDQDILPVDDDNVYTYTIVTEPALRWIWLPTILTAVTMMIFNTLRQFMPQQPRV